MTRTCLVKSYTRSLQPRYSEKLHDQLRREVEIDRACMLAVEEALGDQALDDPEFQLTGGFPALAGVR